MATEHDSLGLITLPSGSIVLVTARGGQVTLNARAIAEGPETSRAALKHIAEVFNMHSDLVDYVETAAPTEEDRSATQKELLRRAREIER